MVSIRCLFGCYSTSSEVKYFSETQLSTIIIKDLLIEVLNEIEKYNSNKHISIKMCNETDEIMDGLEEILQELVIIKENLNNKVNSKKNDS
jgi:hypothetical protein